MNSKKELRIDRLKHWGRYTEKGTPVNHNTEEVCQNCRWKRGSHCPTGYTPRKGPACADFRRKG